MDDERTPFVQTHTQHVSLARALPVLGRSAVALPCAPGTTSVPTLLSSFTSQASLQYLSHSGAPTKPQCTGAYQGLADFQKSIAQGHTVPGIVLGRGHMNSCLQWASTPKRETQNGTVMGSRPVTTARMFSKLWQAQHAWQPRGRLRRWASHDKLAATQAKDQGKIPGTKVQYVVWEKTKYLLVGLYYGQGYGDYTRKKKSLRNHDEDCSDIKFLVAKNLPPSPVFKDIFILL